MKGGHGGDGGPPVIPLAEELSPADLAEHYARLRERILALFEDPLLPGYSRTETAILRALARSPHGVSTEGMIAVLYGDRADGTGDDRMLQVYISRLRKRTGAHIVRIQSDSRKGGHYSLDAGMKAVVDALEEAARAYADGMEKARLLAIRARYGVSSTAK